MASFVARVGTRPRTIDPESSSVAEQAHMGVLGGLERRDMRGHPHLSADEVDKLVRAARRSRHGLRDATLLLLAYHHDLPLSDLLSLRWEQVDFKHGMVRTGGLRGDGGIAHALRESELQGLRMLARDGAWYPLVFCADGGVPLEGKDVVRMLKCAGVAAKLGFAVHPHMLRHACGLKRRDDAGHDWAFQYLGHRSVPGGAKFADAARRSGEFWKS